MAQENRAYDVPVWGDLLRASQKDAVKESSAKLYQAMHAGVPSPTDKSVTLIDEIWPEVRGKQEVTPTLVLAPMERLGGEPGKSGNLVVGARFFAESGQIPNDEPSRALIIKISPDPYADDAADNRKKLTDEWIAAKDFASHFSDRKQFACPLFGDENEGSAPVVLWAPCESPAGEYPPQNVADRQLFVQVDQMAKYIRAASPSIYTNSSLRAAKVDKIIDAVRSLRQAHKAHNQQGNDFRHPTNLVEHYRKELREFWGQDPDWSHPWQELWKNATPQSDFGDGEHNPAIVCAKLYKMGPKPLRLGVIHGDLHPRNIVFAKDGGIRIIDFGWTKAMQHIAKDFVLLEANLRFMTLPPFLPRDEVTKLLDWVQWTSKKPDLELKNQECIYRAKMIWRLRQVAQEHIGNATEWDTEYVAPLFLVSLGLLKYSCDADCAWAARYTVRRLADYLVDALNLKENNP